MNKKQIILLILGVVLVVSGTMVLALFDNELKDLVGGGLIGGGIGLMMPLFQKKKT